MQLIDIVIALALGALFGIFVGRRTGLDRQRREELENELLAARASAARYREQVASHFEETSGLLKGLTLQYRHVYDHLAEGARTLCPDRMVELGRTDAMQALLSAGAGEPERSVTTASDDVGPGAVAAPPGTTKQATASPGALASAEDPAADETGDVRSSGGAGAEPPDVGGSGPGAAGAEWDPEDDEPAPAAPRAAEPVAEVGPPPLSRYAFRRGSPLGEAAADGGAEDSAAGVDRRERAGEARVPTAH